MSKLKRSQEYGPDFALPWSDTWLYSANIQLLLGYFQFQPSEPGLDNGGPPSKQPESSTPVSISGTGPCQQRESLELQRVKSYLPRYIFGMIILIFFIKVFIIFFIKSLMIFLIISFKIFLLIFLLIFLELQHVKSYLARYIRSISS